MDSQIEMIINELGVKVEERENLDADGHYVACMNTIVIKLIYLSIEDKEPYYMN